MTTTFITGLISGKQWYNGACWIFEFKENGREYLGASLQPDFATAIVVEQIPGLELQQLRELEDLVHDNSTST